VQASALAFERPAWKKFSVYPIGYFHIDLAIAGAPKGSSYC